VNMWVGTELFVCFAITGVTLCTVCMEKHLALLSADKIICPALDFIVCFHWSGKQFFFIFEKWRGWVSREIGCIYLHLKVQEQLEKVTSHHHDY